MQRRIRATARPVSSAPAPAPAPVPVPFVPLTQADVKNGFEGLNFFNFDFKFFGLLPAQQQ